MESWWYFMALITLSSAADWDYIGEHGPAYWKNDYPDCGKPYQSPIDIITTNTVENEEFTHFVFENYDNMDAKLDVSNNGHTVGAVVAANISVAGGGLDGRYYAAQFHFHWGSNDSIGSGHIVDGINYPAELHIVHHHANHPGVVKALDKDDGLAVLGVYLKLGAHNEAYEKLFKHLSNVTYKGDSVLTDHVPLQDLLPSDLTEFWRYSGSLTTPPCFESVVWTVFKKPVELSHDQFEALRALKFNEAGANVSRPMVDNDRPVQPINNRTVYSCKTREPDVHYIFSGDHDVDVDTGDEKIHWEYKGKYGPSHWGEYYSDCSKSSQSPINIVRKETVYDSDIPAFSFSGYNKTSKDDKYVIQNNGHTVGCATPSGILVSQGGLPESCTADQFHFHWGEVDNKGSEHTIDGQSYPLELHIVHHNNKFADLNTAVDKEKGLAVLGIFFKIGRHNYAFDLLTKYLKNASFWGDTADVEPFPLEQLLPYDLTSFYRYSGSLTTPPCYESVVWTVFHQPVQISKAQLEEFRLLKKSKRGDQEVVPMGLNYRPVQPLGNRIVYTTVHDPEFHDKESHDSAPFLKQCPLVVLFSLCALHCFFGVEIMRFLKDISLLQLELPKE